MIIAIIIIYQIQPYLFFSFSSKPKTALPPANPQFQKILNVNKIYISSCNLAGYKPPAFSRSQDIFVIIHIKILAARAIREVTMQNNLFFPMKFYGI